MSVPNSNWKTTTMTAISKLRMSGPYRPGWEKSWPYHVSVKVPLPLRTDDVKLKAKTVARGPSTNRPNKNQTVTVQIVRSSVVRRNGHLIRIPSPRESRSSPDDILRQRGFQGPPLGPAVVEDHRPGHRERNASRRVGKSRQDRTEVESTDVRLNLVPVQEIDEGHRHRIWMAFDDARREHDGDQEALSPEEGEIERDPRALFQVDQRDAFVAQRDVERPVDDAENVRAGIGRLDDRVGQGSSPGGGRDILEEHHGVDAIVAQERMRKSERRVEGREIRGGTELGVVHLRERAPREGVPQVPSSHAPTHEIRRDRCVPPDLERQEIAGVKSFFQVERGRVEEQIGLGMAARHPKPVVLLARADVDEGDVRARRCVKPGDDERLEQVPERGRRVDDEGPLLDFVQVREREGESCGQDEDGNRERLISHRVATPRSARPRLLSSP